MAEEIRDLDDRETYEDGPLTGGHEGFSGAAGPSPAPLERELWC